MATQITPVRANYVGAVPMSLGDAQSGEAVAITSGGTGEVTAQAAINSLTGVAAATAEYVLTKDTGTSNAIWKPATGGGGGGGSFIAAGTGAVTRTMQNKARDFISVMDYGAVADGVTDCSAAFNATIAALPAGGGRIVVPGGVYVLNSAVPQGTKSIFWDMDPSAVFSGSGVALNTGNFPYCATNSSQLAVGPLIKSYANVHSLDSNGGIQALGVEIAQQPGSGANQSVAIYCGAYTNEGNTAANIWAINPLITVGAAAKGVAQCIEVDVNNLSTAGAYVKGISISGASTTSPDVALEILGPAGAPWKKGIHIYYSTIGLAIDPAVSCGVSINSPGQTTNTPIAVRANVTNGDTVFIQRYDAGTSGFFIRCVNDTNSASLAAIRGDGQMQAQTFYGGNVQLIAGAQTGAAGTLCIGNTQAGTASSGSATLPGNPAGFLAWFYGSTTVKVPFYNN